MKNIFIISLFLFFFSCSQKILVPENYKSYEIGQLKETYIGNPMIIVETQDIQDTNRWVGVAFSPTGYEQKIVSFKQELIYGGKIGNIIKIHYREYLNNLARSAFAQNLEYDLSDSNFIRFKNFSFEILDADNSVIKFKVTSDNN